MNDPANSIWQRSASVIIRKYRWVLCVGFLLTILGSFFTTRLKLNANIAALLPEHYPSVQTIRRSEKEVGGFETMRLLLQGADFETLKRYADRLAVSLEASQIVLGVDYKRSVDWFEKHALLYLEASELEEINTSLRDRIKSEKLAANPLFISLDDGEEIKTSNLRKLEELEEKYAATDSKRYFTNKEKTILVMSVFPDGLNSDVAFARSFYKELQRIVGETPYKDLSADLFVEYGGNYKNKLDEFQVIIDDVKSTAIVGMTAVFLLIAVYFRRLQAAVLVALSLIFGIAWTFGVTYWAIGELNIMTVFLFVVLFGLGIDYGIHLLARYAEEKQKGKVPVEAMRDTLLHSGGALVTTAATTALAFFALTVADFRGFSHFGFIAGTGVIMSLLAVLTTLPALVLVAELDLGIGVVSKKNWANKATSSRFPKTTLILALGGCLAIFGCYALTKLELEYDFTALRSQIPASQAVKKKLRSIFTESNSPAIVLAKDRAELEEVRKIVEQKQNTDTTPTIDKFRSLYSFLPANQNSKLPLIRQIRKTLEDPALGDLKNDDADRVAKLREMAKINSIVAAKDLPADIRRMFQGKPGAKMEFGLVLPSVQLRNGRNAIAFAQDVGTLKGENGKEFHGSNASVIFANMMLVIVDEGRWVVLLTLLAVVLVVAVTLRNAYGTTMALLPLGVGLLWLFAIMVTAGLKLNFYNLVVVPSILGIGIDSGVHIFHRYRAEGVGSVPRVLSTTGIAVAISSLTTMVGFGGMVVAHHPGLESIGTLAMIGIFLCMLASLTVLPAALQFFEDRAKPSSNRSD